MESKYSKENHIFNNLNKLNIGRLKSFNTIEHTFTGVDICRGNKVVLWIDENSNSIWINSWEYLYFMKNNIRLKDIYELRIMYGLLIPYGFSYNKIVNSIDGYIIQFKLRKYNWFRTIYNNLTYRKPY